MRLWCWLLVLPLLLVASGCGDQERREIRDIEQARYMAQQPALNGYNMPYITFWVVVGVVIVVALLAGSISYVRAARHESLARIAEAKAKDSRVD